MQIIGETISHAKYGKGVISDKSDTIITVIFQDCKKQFHFPEAFEKHLVLKSKTKQQQVNLLIDGMIKKREILENTILQRRKVQEKIMALKISPNSQAAFGFTENKKEEVLQTWTLTTGTYLSGKSKGQPRIPLKMFLNSACLLTECSKGEPEQHRKIFGVFMVKDNFEGKLCTDGIIQSHEKYRISLEPSEELFFWDYFPESERKNKWGCCEIIYFPNFIMKKILQDMKKTAITEKKKQMLEDFSHYFVKINKLTN